MNTESIVKHFCSGWIALGLFVTALGAAPSTAQSRNVDTPYFAKLGIGVSEYTGDLPYEIENHLFDFDFREFSHGTGFPFLATGELGYQFSPKLAVALGLQVGAYPFIGWKGRRWDQWRYTTQLLGRYRFGDAEQTLAPYVDGGLNVTFGGHSPPTSAGFGPSVGGGLDILLSRSLSFFVESRLNLVFPDDAVDGEGSYRDPFDLVNQLLGFGVKIRFEDFWSDASPEEPTPRGVPADTADEEIGQSPRSDQSPHPDTSRYEEMVLIPSGTFIMGLTDEDPLSLQNAGRKRVTVSPFYLDQYEVTNAEYRDYLSQLSPEERTERLPDSTAWSEARTQDSWTAYFRSDYYADYPVVAVTWTEARAYCQAQNKRLPTEAEWEYAARAGHLGRIYPWEGLSARGQGGEYLANFKPSSGYSADGYAFTAPVDEFPPNDWDLYNMAGNVAEWTRDAYTPSYDNLSDFNPSYRDENEPRRVIRGGAWNSNASFIGVGMRDTQRRDEASVDVGFRCAREVTSLDREEATGEDTTGAGGTK